MCDFLQITTQFYFTKELDMVTLLLQNSVQNSRGFGVYAEETAQ